MLNEKVIKVIQDALNSLDKSIYFGWCQAREIAEALWDSGLVSNSSKALDEQELNIYKWTAIENDGYTHSESGVANNMLEAFINATEHSPSYHKYIEIEKVEEEDYTDAHKELLKWYKEVR